MELVSPFWSLFEFQFVVANDSVNIVVCSTFSSKWTAFFQPCQRTLNSEQFLSFSHVKMKLILEFTNSCWLFIVWLLWTLLNVTGWESQVIVQKRGPELPATVWKACHCNPQFELAKSQTYWRESTFCMESHRGKVELLFSYCHWNYCRFGLHQIPH
jgi:hypothetical protein